MTQDLNKLAYMNGSPVEREYFFPYENCYFGNRIQVECLHQWKQKQIEKIETFRRKVFGLEIPIHASENREIKCEIQKHMGFFMEQRESIKNLILRQGIYCETSSGKTCAHDGNKWQVETISVAGHWRLWAKLKK